MSKPARARWEMATPARQGAEQRMGAELRSPPPTGSAATGAQSAASAGGFTPSSPPRSRELYSPTWCESLTEH